MYGAPVSTKLNVYSQRPIGLIGDAENVDVGQADEQFAHADSAAQSRASRSTWTAPRWSSARSDRSLERVRTVESVGQRSRGHWDRGPEAESRSETEVLRPKRDRGPETAQSRQISSVGRTVMSTADMTGAVREIPCGCWVHSLFTHTLAHHTCSPFARYATDRSTAERGRQLLQSATSTPTVT